MSPVVDASSAEASPRSQVFRYDKQAVILLIEFRDGGPSWPQHVSFNHAGFVVSSYGLLVVALASSSTVTVAA